MGALLEFAKRKEEVITTPTDAALDSRARRAAKRAGLVAKKSRWRYDSVDNFGGFMLVNPRYNCVVAGSRFDMTAEQVIEYCSAA
jgi:hypothetical protein